MLGLMRKSKHRREIIALGASYRWEVAESNRRREEAEARTRKVLGSAQVMKVGETALSERGVKFIVEVPMNVMRQDTRTIHDWFIREFDRIIRRALREGPFAPPTDLRDERVKL